MEEAPLAKALEHLTIIANLTKKTLNAGTINDLEKLYLSFGWEVDNSALKTIKFIEKENDIKAVSNVLKTIYFPWLEESSRYLQTIIRQNGYPEVKTKRDYLYGDCILFVDGLRFDLAMLLGNNLKDNEYLISEEMIWAALPTVTATGKAAISPVFDKITGLDDNTDFEPVITSTNQRADTSRLRSLMTDNGWTVLETGDSGNGTGKAWCEFGDIDKAGHEQGWKLAKTLNVKLKEIKDKIVSLLEAGWQRVIVVTDHGWLLLPGKLPKTELHRSLTENKWGRCSAVKQGVNVDDQYPWYWNHSLYFTLAEGVSCYIAGKEYTHGGISLQECLNLRLTITKKNEKQKSKSIQIENSSWKGLRCVIILKGDPLKLRLDIRLNAGDKASSVVEQVNSFRDDGTTSAVVSNESLEGKKAYIVIIDDTDSLVCMRETTVGGE